MNVSAASLFSSTEVPSPEFSSSRVVTSTNLYSSVTVFTLSSVGSLDASTGAGVSVAGAGVSSATGSTVEAGVASTTSGVGSGVDSTTSGVGSGVVSAISGVAVGAGVSSTFGVSTISTVSGEDEPSTLLSSAFTEEKCTQVKTISAESVSLVNLDNLIFFFLFFMLCSPFLVYFLKFCCHQLELIYH